MPLADVLAPLNDHVFRFAGEAVTWTELLGFVTGIASVWLAAVQRVSNFPVGLANSAFFLLLFADARLFADATLQVVYIVLNGFGWYAWLRYGPDRTELPVTWAGRRELVLTAIGVAVATVVLIPVLHAAHGNSPYLDALTTALSLGAQALLCLKRVENWWVWIAADVIYIPLYASRGLVLTAIVYTVFLGICVTAVRAWVDELRLVPA